MVGGVAVEEAAAVGLGAAALCARTPACLKGIGAIMGAVGLEVLSAEDRKKAAAPAAPKPMPSTSGNSTNMSPNNGDDEKQERKIVRSDHAQLRASEGRNVGKAKNNDIWIQPSNGRYVVRGPNGREHIIQKDAELVTTVNSRSNSSHLNLIRNGERRTATQEEINLIKSFVK